MRNGQLDGMFVRVSWPSMSAVANIDSINASDIVMHLRARRESPHAVSKSLLEEVVISRHGDPILISQYGNLQEYPSKNTSPHYRSKDAEEVFSDGLPTYFFCNGPPVSLKGLSKPESDRQKCTIEQVWTDSFQIDISFSRTYLAEWRKIHDSSMALINSLELNKNTGLGVLLLEEK